MDLTFSQYRFSAVAVQVVEEATVADRQVAVLAVASDDLVEQIAVVDSLADLLDMAVASVVDPPVAVVDPAGGSVDNCPVAVYLAVGLDYSGCLDLLDDLVY